MSNQDVAHTLFLSLVEAAGFPEPRSKTHADGELVFAKDSGIESIGSRRWRFDYAWPEWKIAIERQGGVWKGGKGGGKGRGGHSGGSGQINDMAKWNAAILLGWRLLLYAPEQIATGLSVRQLKELGLGRSGRLPFLSEINQACAEDIGG